MNNKEYEQHYKDYIKHIESDDFEEEGLINYRSVKYPYQLNMWDLYFVDYLLDNNYDVRIKKKYNGKTIFEISKDGVTEKYEVYQKYNYSDMWKFCETFKEYFEKSKFIKDHLNSNLSD